MYEIDKILEIGIKIHVVCQSTIRASGRVFLVHLLPQQVLPIRVNRIIHGRHAIRRYDHVPMDV